MDSNNSEKNRVSPDQQKELLTTLEERFREYPDRHPELEWADVKARLEANPDKLWSLFEMERTGGEPDVIDRETGTGKLIFFDCSAETPEGRRNTCYDREALESRKANKPEHNVMEMADEMGVELLTEAQYRELQKLGEFDLKTSSWVKTPPEIRKLGGALFMDRRYDHVFIYHNGAQSYYGARGFRSALKI